MIRLSSVRKALISKSSEIHDVQNRFSVLLPIVAVKDELHILFTKRVHTLNRQPGEICFPGGRIEKDESALTAAVRETSEELNIPYDKIRVFNQLDTLVTPFNTIVYSFCGYIDDASVESIKFNKEEVDSIFTIPLDYLMNYVPESYDANLIIEVSKEFPYHLIENGEKYKWGRGRYPVYFYQYKDYVIWGITAKILKNLLDILKGEL